MYPTGLITSLLDYESKNIYCLNCFLLVAGFVFCIHAKLVPINKNRPPQKGRALRFNSTGQRADRGFPASPRALVGAAWEAGGVCS